METTDTLAIPICGHIDFQAAQTVASRIRMAIRNGFQAVVLEFDNDAVIASAEFLAFVATSAQYLEREARRLEVRGISGRQRAVLALADMDRLVMDDTAACEHGASDADGQPAPATES